MTIEHLMYQHDGITFGCLVDADNLENYRDGNMTAAEVLDVFEVFKFASGKQGNLLRPSKSELNTAFDTDKVDDVADVILHRGRFAKHGKKSSKKISKKDAAHVSNSRLHVAHSRAL